MFAMKQIIYLLFLGWTAIAGAAEYSPSALVRQYFSLLERQQWREASKLYDPEMLRDFRERMSFVKDFPERDRVEIYGKLFGIGFDDASFTKLTDADFFAAILRFAMMPAISSEVTFKNLTTLGEVSEGDDVRHVVIRNKGSVGEIEIEMIEVVSCKNTTQGWRLVPSGAVKGLAALIQQRIKKTPAANAVEPTRTPEGARGPP